MSGNIKRRTLRRVDVQVSIFTAVIVLISSLCVFALCYHMTYNDMIKSLKDRVHAISDYVSENLDEATFDAINVTADVDKTIYKETKAMLENVRDTTGVRYLYTAKENDEGEFIYVVDGLDMKALDFRYPGDLIEEEIIGDMHRALEGEEVLPNEIKITEWGKIFITYLPIHSEDKIIGVIGIEFEAEHQYDTYLKLRHMTPVIIGGACLVALLVALVCFRRISNPLYQDMANTDQLTQLKSRNAFMVDMENLNVMRKKARAGVLVLDLNNLKQVNDRLGHDEGDRYLQKTADVMRAVRKADMVMYRTGGDEFAIIMNWASDSAMESCASQLRQEFEPYRGDWKVDTSLAIGYAVYDPKIDESINDTYKRADARMYEDKKKLSLAQGEETQEERDGCPRE